MNSNSNQDALAARWTLEGMIPLRGVADGASWHRARTVATGEGVTLFVVRGAAALEAADAVRRAYLVEDPHLMPVREIVVLDDPREAGTATGADEPITVVEYPLPSAPPLAALLSGGPLHPETARSIIGEAATGLEVARRRGVRHQFLDSNRLFVDTAAGTVTVLGIGVEAAAHEGLDRSREIASFQDTAALVALLYRALTGKAPQHGADGDVPRPSTLVDTEIPQDLDLLCDLVLNESGDEIPETTRSLIAALEPWQSIPVTLEAYPSAAAPAPRPEPATAPVPVAAEPEAVPDDAATVVRPAPSAEATEATPPARAAEPAPTSPSPEADGPDPAAGAIAVGAAGAVAGGAALAASSIDDDVDEDTVVRPAAAPSEAPHDAVDEDTIARPASPHANAPVDGSLDEDTIVRPTVGAAVPFGAAGAVAPPPAAPAPPVAPAPSADSSAAAPGAGAAEGPAADAPRSAPSPSAETASRARGLVQDLHLDRKRDGSAFPGHLEITRPQPVVPADDTADPAQATDAAQAIPTGAAGAAGIAAAGAAGMAAAGAAVGPDAVPGRSSDLPARTSGTHWPGATGSRDAGSSSPTAAATASPLAPLAPSAAGAAPVAPAAADQGLETAALPPTAMTAADPHEASDVPHAAPAADATAPQAATEDSGPTPPEGPIVIRGRERSPLDEPVETTVPMSRSSLLRDVVAVAVDQDGGDSYVYSDYPAEQRSRQAQWIIIGAILLVIVAMVVALTSVTAGLRDRMANPLNTSPVASETAAPEETDEAPVEPTAEDTAEPTLPAPQLAGVELFEVGHDGDPDNADQRDRITDGDPGTYWSTQHYASPDYGGLKEGVGLYVDLAEPSRLTAVTVTTARNTGGVIELRAVNDDGTLGDVLATGALAGDGQVRLQPDEPIDVQRVAIWLPELPPDSNESGRFRARIAEIAVE
ncbi:hypothetical protein [Brachybacterium sp. J153]|uniref:hypothetical protein n=1 Tax=Brachybacterium sp. J153 TaxID=3116488 RepID=UPI002E7A7835|nr:hypothetical protein [Brachybacterium sp. J153]MEE1618537.1 hypothetical protein [Brachybacterium sp. J153]